MTWTVTGFDFQKKHFQHLFADGTLAHAYLFSGPDMIGKRSFAHDLYRHTDGPVIDLLTIAPRLSEGESKIYIDDIREVATFLSRKPLGKYKFVVIDAADQLTAEASNALLKVLEEPPFYAVLILVSAQPKLLLPTVVSRCQEVTFRAHAPEIINSLLADRRISEEDREILSTVGGGRLGWVIRTVESGSIKEVHMAVADLRQLIGKNIAERLIYAKKLHERDEYPTVINYWLRWAHTQLAKNQATARAVQGLMRLQYLVSQPQYNHRLAIEQFLVNL